MQTTRREFFKMMGVLALAATVPLEWDRQVLELEPVIDEEMLNRALKMGRGSKSSIVFHLDTEQLWKAVSLQDQWGHEWRTEDEGAMWTWGSHWFNAEGECSWA